VADSTPLAGFRSSEVAFSDGVAAGPLGATRIDHGTVPPPQLEPFARFIAETLLPELHKRSGYRSLEILIVRATGDVRVVSTWDGPAARRAAADAFVLVLRHASEFQLRPIAVEEP
jgi:hypothetical protein